MKTAMQQLIDKLSEFKKELSDKYDADPYVTKGVSVAICEANKLLEEEKRQIVGAYVQGKMDEHDLPYGMAYLSKLNSSEQSAEQYYNQTYNNENNTTRQST